MLRVSSDDQSRMMGKWLPTWIGKGEGEGTGSVEGKVLSRRNWRRRRGRRRKSVRIDCGQWKGPDTDRGSWDKT